MPEFDKDLYWKRRGKGLTGQTDLTPDYEGQEVNMPRDEKGNLRSTKLASKKAHKKNTKRARKELSDD